MSEYTSSEDDPFNDAINTLDPDPNISLLGITPGECIALATVSPKLFNANTIHTFFMRATKHKGAVCLTSIDYKHIMEAHMRQAATINKLKSDNNYLKSDNNKFRADVAINHCLVSSIDLNGSYCNQVDSLTAEIMLIKTNLQSATTSSFTATSHITLLTRLLEEAKTSN